jgi:hypothetical protein
MKKRERESAVQQQDRQRQQVSVQHSASHAKVMWVFTLFYYVEALYIVIHDRTLSIPKTHVRQILSFLKSSTEHKSP